MSTSSGSWPPREDRTLWLWIGAALALPLLARAVGAAFWIHGAGVGPYRPTDPVAWLAVVLLVALALIGRRARPFAVAVALQLGIGLVLIATLLQAPGAFLVVGAAGQGLEGMTYVRLAVHYALAVATGIAYVGLGAYVLRRHLARPFPARPEETVMPNFSEIPWIAEHIRLYRTDPEKAHLWDSTPLGGPGLLPTLLLTTRGRKSGEPRALPLIYGTEGEGYVVIASKGGMPQHPLWYRNLEADPECEVQVGAKHFRARARVAQGEERGRLWEKMAEIYPPYLEYQSRAERTIPVVVLDPAG